MKKLIALAQHILAMQDDAVLCTHPEWMEIVHEAKQALKADTRAYNIAVLKDLKENYDMGFYTTKEYEAKVAEITKP